MTDFVNNFIKTFEIGPEATQVGLLTFSESVKREFWLNEFLDKSALVKKVSSLRQSDTEGSSTQTHLGLDYMTNQLMTSAHGLRDGVPHIVIVLTDGNSTHPPKTSAAAQRLKAAGHSVYAIGVGKLYRQELDGIASDPSQVFLVDTFDALSEIKEILAIKVCVKACGERHPADVMFLVDSYRSGDLQTKKALDFMGQVSSNFEIGDASDSQIQVGLVHECLIGGFNFKKYSSKDDLEAGVERVKVHDFADVIEYMTVRSFTVDEGSRPNAKRVAVAIIDSKFPDTKKVKKAADKAKANNIEIFAIGVGAGNNYRELTLVASSPVKEHLFTVDSYDELTNIAEELKVNVCKDL
ncbi:unnamed protein product [Owenia fusiformis]|nr:unnamed protein product [Owenia fusiformis]